MKVPRVGEEFAGYRIEAVLGRGGMGIVFRAEHLDLERKVALKLLAESLSEDDGFRQRFIRESKLAASMDHPNVIPIYGAGETDGLLYIAMRYVEGSDLKEVIKQEGALDPARVLVLLEQVASALDAGHARGLVHRDVKPHNMLIAHSAGVSGDHVYLSDFGLAKQISSKSETFTPNIGGAEGHTFKAGTILRTEALGEDPPGIPRAYVITKVRVWDADAQSACVTIC